MSGLNNNEFRLHQFSVEVCDIIRQIPAGKVLTYGQIARLAGFSNYSRWVGKVLSHHPGTAALPCHRVVNSQGRTAPHWPGQKSLLAAEGITFQPNGRVDLNGISGCLFLLSFFSRPEYQVFQYQYRNDPHDKSISHDRPDQSRNTIQCFVGSKRQ